MLKFRNQRKPTKKKPRVQEVIVLDPIKERVFWNREEIPNDISILLRNLSSHSLIRVKQLFDLQFEKEAEMERQTLMPNHASDSTRCTGGKKASREGKKNIKN